jgi:anti-sigma B factor antagonist
MNFYQTQEGSTTTLWVHGELDAVSTAELRPMVDELVESGHQDIVVDLSGLRAIDSSGVGVLVSLYKRVRAQQGEVRFVGVTAQPLVIFRLLRLDVAFNLGLESEFSPQRPSPAVT